MRKTKSGQFFLLICLLTLFAFPLSARAELIGYNQVYHPPALTMIVRGLSSEADMQVTLVRKNGDLVTLTPKKERRLWESYFRINRHDYSAITTWYGNSYDFKDAVITITDGSERYSYPIPYTELKENGLDDYLIIDAKSGDMRAGIPSLRTAAVVIFHVVIYLLVEGLIFWLHGIRSRRSWIIFLIYTALSKSIVCLLTRTWLNVDPKLYLVFAVGALFYLVIDMAVYLLLLDSESRDKLSRFAAVSNILAAVAMYGALSYLPM